MGLAAGGSLMDDLVTIWSTITLVAIVGSLFWSMR